MSPATAPLLGKTSAVQTLTEVRLFSYIFIIFCPLPSCPWSLSQIVPGDTKVMSHVLPTSRLLFHVPSGRQSRPYLTLFRFLAPEGLQRQQKLNVHAFPHHIVVLKTRFLFWPVRDMARRRTWTGPLELLQSAGIHTRSWVIICSRCAGVGKR